MPLTFNILRSDFMSSFQFSYLLAVNEYSLCTTSLPIFKKFFANLMGVTCYLFIILKFIFSSLLLTLSIFLYICWPFSFSLLQMHMLFILSFFLLFPYVCIYIYVYTYTDTYFYLLSLLQIFSLIPCLLSLFKVYFSLFRINTVNSFQTYICSLDISRRLWTHLSSVLSASSCGCLICILDLQ